MMGIVPFKGTVLRDFCVLFFGHQIAPLGPIRGTLGRFRFFMKICRDIRPKVRSAVYDSPRNGDSAVYDT